MKSKRSIALAVAILVSVIVVGYCVKTLTEWDSVTVELDSVSSLRVSRKPMHRFLAEYYREVSVIKSGRELAPLDYPPDPGGCFPMQIRYYSDGTRRFARLTDHLNDTLIDLQTGRFVPDAAPPEGKETSSFVHEAALPPLRRSFEIDHVMKAVLR